MQVSEYENFKDVTQMIYDFIFFNTNFNAFLSIISITKLSLLN